MRRELIDPYLDARHPDRLRDFFRDHPLPKFSRDQGALSLILHNMEPCLLPTQDIYDLDLCYWISCHQKSHGLSLDFALALIRDAPEHDTLETVLLLQQLVNIVS